MVFEIMFWHVSEKIKQEKTKQNMQLQHVLIALRILLFSLFICSSHHSLTFSGYRASFLFALALNHLSTFFHYLFILSPSKFKYCSNTFSLLFHSFSLLFSLTLTLCLLPLLSLATVWASPCLSHAPSLLPFCLCSHCVSGGSVFRMPPQ